MTTPIAILTAIALTLVASTAPAQQSTDTIAPESTTGRKTNELVRSGKWMVAAANALAAEAGRTILEKGGSAADAAIAIQAVLGLVEPQSSGLGGGAFALWYDSASGKLTTFDARETAPAAATPDLFLDDLGKPLPFFEAVVGGRSVGVPGVPLLLDLLRERYGKLDLGESLRPALDLAENGFAVSPRLAGLLTVEADRLDAQDGSAAYFFPDGKPLAAGDVLKNPAYADALDELATSGAAPFYKGDQAAAIVDAVTSHPTNPGNLALSDFASYEVVERETACVTYRGLDVCGMGPPSSGGTTVGQILKLIEPFDLAALGSENPEAWRLIGDATRLAFADRNRYLADADFVDIPTGLLDESYLDMRSALLRGDVALPAADAGDPPWDKTEFRQDGLSHEAPATTHFVVADGDGNVISMTSSIENAFGARIMANGYLLNNQLTDFSFMPDGDDGPLANRVEPGKRPRSSMAPTIVLEDGRPLYALGSPGGATIIPFVAKTLVALIDWRMDMAQAIALPHLVNISGDYWLESGTEAETFASGLEALGYAIESRDLNSGLHGIHLLADGFEGAADPRREGAVAGD